MPPIIYVANGVDPIDAAHLNQYATIMNAQFGIADTTQVRLGRLVPPLLSAGPGGAVNGQLWLRDSDYRLMVHRNGQNFNAAGPRQRISAGMINTVAINSTSWQTVTQLPITVQGGPLYISLTPAGADVPNPTLDNPNFSVVRIDSPGSTPFNEIFGEVRFTINTNEYLSVPLRFELAGAGATTDYRLSIPPNLIRWYHSYGPAAIGSTWNVALQARVGGTDMRITFHKFTLLVEEM